MRIKNKILLRIVGIDLDNPMVSIYFSTWLFLIRRKFRKLYGRC